MKKKVNIDPKNLIPVKLTDAPTGTLMRLRVLSYIHEEKLCFLDFSSALNGTLKEIGWIETDQVSLFDYLDSEGTLVLQDVFLDSNHCPVIFIPFAANEAFTPDRDLESKRLKKIAREFRDIVKDDEIFNAV